MSTIPYGLSETGFIAKPQSVIIAELETQLADALRPLGGEKLNTKTGVVSQLIGPFGAKARELWELGQAVHSAFDRDNATGAALQQVGAVTGSDQRGETKGRVGARLTLGIAVTVPAGSIVSVTGVPTSRWLTLEDVVSTTAGDYDVECECESTGPVAADSGTLTVIETPVSGWTAVTNPADAEQGALEETDAEYRARQEAELASPGTSPLDAIRADMLRLLDEHEIAGGNVSVSHNPTDATVGSLTPHSVAIAVYDGTDDGSALDNDTIAARIWASVGGGIKTIGGTLVTVLDSEGQLQGVRFARPTPITVYATLAVDVAKVRGWDPDSGVAAIKAALVTRGRALFGVGDDVVATRWSAGVFEVAGVVDLTSFALETNPAPVSTTNITINNTELPVFDTSRIVVTPTLGGPP